MIQLTIRKQAGFWGLTGGTTVGSETRDMDLYENAPDTYASVNAKTALIDACNMTLANTLGYAKEEIVGHSVYNIQDLIAWKM